MAIHIVSGRVDRIEVRVPARTDSVGFARMIVTAIGLRGPSTRVGGRFATRSRRSMRAPAGVCGGRRHPAAGRHRQFRVGRRRIVDGVSNCARLGTH